MLRSDRASSAESGPNGVVPSPSRENPDLCLLGPLEGHLTGSVSDGDQPVIDSTVANRSQMWEHQRVSRSHAITFDPIVTTCALHQQATSLELLLCLERHLVGRDNKADSQRFERTSTEESD